MSDDARQKEYKWVPDGFLDDINLVPHNFDMPENDHHGEYVHDQLRYDLFYDAYNKVATIEGAYLKDDKDYVKLKEIKKSEPSWIEAIHRKLFIPRDDEQLSCEEWTLDRNGTDNIFYKVHCYQSPNDRFYTKVFPPKWSQYFELLYTFGGL